MSSTSGKPDRRPFDFSGLLKISPQEENRNKSLYDYLAWTDRSGIILSRKDGDIVGQHERVPQGQIEENEERRIERFNVIRNGQNVGVLTVTTYRQDGDRYSKFEPASGVDIFYDDDLTQEMNTGKRK